MLNKLRRRFVAISMSIIAVVLSFFYVVSALIFFATITTDMRSVLHAFAVSPESVLSPQIGSNDTENSLFALHSGNVCVVEAKELGNITVLEFSRANMDEAIVSRAVAFALDTEYEFGHIPDLNLLYYKHSYLMGTRIALLIQVSIFSTLN